MPVYLGMYVNRHKYFRWTRRTTWLTFAYVVAVPAVFGYMAYTTDVSVPGDFLGVRRIYSVARLLRFLANGWWQGKYEMRGKRRGDTIVEF